MKDACIGLNLCSKTVSWADVLFAYSCTATTSKRALYEMSPIKLTAHFYGGGVLRNTPRLKIKFNVQLQYGINTHFGGALGEMPPRIKFFPLRRGSFRTRISSSKYMVQHFVRIKSTMSSNVVNLSYKMWLILVDFHC